MTNIKTPEEIAKEAVMTWKIDKHTTLYPITGRDIEWRNVPHLIESVAQAISAERNASLEKIKELEAEANAVRSKTIEECAKVADNHNDFGASRIATAIRALNNEKE